MKKVAVLATVILGLTGAALGTTHAHASTVCASASAQVTVNGSDVVNQTVAQCE